MLTFHRFRRLGDRVVLTNQQGAWLVVTSEEYAAIQASEVAPGSDLLNRLDDANMLSATFDVPQAALALRRRNAFVGGGPNLHILVVTLRCNETCVYCHASRAPRTATGVDMTPEVAEAALDLIFDTTSSAITIEFQGGEPLLVFELLVHIVGSALKRATRTGKTVDFTLVSNLSLMDDEKLAWLLEHRVQICTSIDGPVEIHDGQRRLPSGSAYERATHWIERVNAAYEDRGLDSTLYHVEALLTVTRPALEHAPEIVDTYVRLGCRALFARPLDPFGFANRTRARFGYDVDEYLAFYRTLVDTMIELNRRGTEVLERFASIFLTKILTGDDPNYLDIRSPCGAGIGQVAYNYDGSIFTCDEGRMLHEGGDDAFLIGRVGESSHRDLMGHETVRAIAIASNLDGQPECASCAYRPYCGVCPVYNHHTQGSIFGRTRESFLCGVHKGIQDYLFEKLSAGDDEIVEIFRRWTTARARTHFVHDAREQRG